MKSSGDFIVTWRSAGQDGDNEGVFGQLLNAQGTPIGNEFQVNSYTTNRQHHPAVAVDLGGDFVVTWVSYKQVGSHNDIFAQRFNAMATPVGAEFQVNTYTTNVQSIPAVAMNSLGDFVVTWSSYGSSGTDSSNYSVQGQAFNAQATPIGNEFQVNSFTAQDQRLPSVAMETNGDFIITWRGYGPDSDNAGGIFARKFKPGGTPVGTEFHVNTYTTNIQSSPKVAMEKNLGDFVITWESDGQDSSYSGVYAQIFNSDATPVGSEFRVNAYTTNYQRYPEVAMDGDGDFVIAWISYEQTSNRGVFSQAFNAKGTPVGLEFQVTSDTTVDQDLPAIAMGMNGDFLITWKG